MLLLDSLDVAMIEDLVSAEGRKLCSIVFLVDPRFFRH